VEWDFSEHAYPINCLAWSTDDTILLTGAEQQIKMWDMKVSHVLANDHITSDAATTDRDMHSNISHAYRDRNSFVMAA
jgi:WD40 repeat protein